MSEAVHQRGVQLDPSKIITTDTGEDIRLDSLGYVAYVKDGSCIAFCERFPDLTARAASGGQALTAARYLLEQVAAGQQRMRAV